jgi:hypothetical protein
MKVVIITVPMKSPQEISKVQYPVDGNKSIEYDKPVRCPINGVLAKSLQKGEEVKVIYIMTSGDNSECPKNKDEFINELAVINREIGATFSYDTVDIAFLPTKQTYNKLITDLAEKIPENAEIYTDITYGFKPEILSLFCALRFVEEFRNAVVQFIVYGKVEFKKDNKKVHPKLYDITSLYYLFKLMGTMGATDAKTAAKTLKDFFAM